LAVIVGGAALPFRGTVNTMRVNSPVELGEAILYLATLLPSKRRP